VYQFDVDSVYAYYYATSSDMRLASKSISASSAAM
jgi:hypothetical protein